MTRPIVTDAELWGLAKGHQASTALARSQFFGANIDGLCDGFAQGLDGIHWFGLNLTWSCEFFFGGSTGNNVAAAQPGGEFNDLDLLLVMTPTSADPTNVSVGLQQGSGSKFNKCCLDENSSGALTRHVLDDTALEGVWEAFHLAVTEFINYRGFLEKSIEFKDDGTARQMRCSFTINDIPIDVLPALKTSHGIHLILRRKVDVDGSNIVRSFGIMTARQIAGLHPKASWMICALKHIAKIVRRIDAPGCLFEAVVIKIFGKKGWIKGHPDGTIRFSQAWHDCWEMIGSAESISPPGAAADEGENLFSRMGDNEHRLRALARAMASLKPKDLQEILQHTANAPSIYLWAFSGVLHDQSLSAEGARRIASLPDKAKHLICALKHVVKVAHGLEVPGSMFESVVLKVFKRHRWTGDKGAAIFASITFIEAWRLCWRRILSWKPISAPDKSLEEHVDLLSGIDKTELTRVGEALSSIDEKPLLDECLNGTRESLSRLIASMSQSSTSTSGGSSSSKKRRKKRARDKGSSKDSSAPSDPKRRAVVGGQSPASTKSSPSSSKTRIPNASGHGNIASTSTGLGDNSGGLAIVTLPSTIDEPTLVEISRQLKLNQDIDIVSVQKTILLQPSYIGDSAVVSMLVSHEEPYRSSALPWRNVLSPALPCKLFAALRIEHLCVRIYHSFPNEIQQLTCQYTSIISAGSSQNPSRSPAI